MRCQSTACWPGIAPVAFACFDMQRQTAVTAYFQVSWYCFFPLHCAVLKPGPPVVVGAKSSQRETVACHQSAIHLSQVLTWVPFTAWDVARSGKWHVESKLPSTSSSFPRSRMIAQDMGCRLDEGRGRLIIFSSSPAHPLCWKHNTALQWQAAVTAYLKSKQLLLSAFVLQNSTINSNHNARSSLFSN